MNLSPHFTLREFCRSSTADRLGIESHPTDRNELEPGLIAERMRCLARAIELQQDVVRALAVLVNPDGQLAVVYAGMFEIDRGAHPMPRTIAAPKRTIEIEAAIP